MNPALPVPQEIVWQEPPKPARGQTLPPRMNSADHLLDEIVEPLAAHPGRWANVSRTFGMYGMQHDLGWDLEGSWMRRLRAMGCQVTRQVAPSDIGAYRYRQLFARWMEH